MGRDLSYSIRKHTNTESLDIRGPSLLKFCIAHLFFFYTTLRKKHAMHRYVRLWGLQYTLDSKVGLGGM